LVDGNTVADQMGLCVAFQKRFEDFLRDSHRPFFDRRVAIRSPVFEIIWRFPLISTSPEADDELIEAIWRAQSLFFMGRQNQYRYANLILPHKL
jgi:hypothetical protein